MDDDFRDSFELSGSITPGGPEFTATVPMFGSVWVSIDYVEG